MSADLIEIVHHLKLQLERKGSAALRLLATAFAVNDKGDHRGCFNFEEFEAILGKAGLFMKRQDMTKLYRYFDKDGDERVSYSDFLTGIQGEMSDRRGDIVRRVWEKVSGGQEVVAMNTIASQFDPTKHPKVLAGEKTAEEIYGEFVKAFEGAGTRGPVSWEEFLYYYNGISAAVPYNDDYFIMLTERTWGVEEGGKDKVSAELLRKLQNVLREKIRQKCLHGSEQESLRLKFKHYDLNDSGTVSYDEFLQALERFGIVLEPKVSRALFNDFDSDGSGQVNYAEFCAILYESSSFSASFKPNKTNNDAGQTAVIPPSEPANPDLPTIVYVLGGPGSGKGTQCAKIAKEFDYVHICAGDLIRAEMAKGGSSEHGQAIADHITNGRPVPVDISVALIRRAMEDNVSAGNTLFLLDGFPRNLENLEGWDQLMGPYVNTPFALLIDAPPELLEARLLKRGETSGSDDDSLEVVQKRIQLYLDDTTPVLDKLADEGKLRAVSGVATPEDVYDEVRRHIASIQQ